MQNDVVEQFRQELVIAGYSPRTIKMYVLYVKAFLDFTKKEITGVDRGDIVAFLAAQKEKKRLYKQYAFTNSFILKVFFQRVPEIKGY